MAKKTANRQEDPKDRTETREDPRGSEIESEVETEDEEGVPLSDLEFDGVHSDVDIVPYQKLYKDNHAALTQALSTFALPIATLPFYVHQSVTSSEEFKGDINDDLNRELAFYKQALEAAKHGRQKLLQEGVPFSRPSDYFAEMFKDDEHMNKIKEKIVAEEAAKKASEAAKRQRDLKKYGKQVQVAKLQEREKGKKEALEKLKALKRKRQDGDIITAEDDFDVELEAVEDRKGHKRPKMTREKRNERYGFGGSKRKMKRNDDDVGDLSNFSKGTRTGHGGKKKINKRPGKARRMKLKNK